MKTALGPHPAYKGSGAPWLGELPEKWEMRKLRHVLRQVTERNRPDWPLLSVVREKGVVLRDVSSKDENHNFIPDDLSNYKVVRADQFAMNKMKAWQGSYGISAFDGIVSPAYFVFSLVGVSPDFFHIAIRSRAYIPFFTAASDGVRIGQWDLSPTRMREIPFFVPPGSEQAAIVRFLGYVDRRIRRYIRAKQKLIKLLEEQKQAMSHQAVTGQIDVRTGEPYPAYKDSGVEWLGQVPEQWEVRKLRFLFDRQGSGTTPPGDAFYGGGIPWVMTGDLSDGALQSTKRTVTAEALDQLSALKLFPPGSLIVAMYGATIGKTGLLTMNACTNQACCVLALPRPNTNPQYFQAVVNVARSHLIEQSYGGGQPNINAEIVRSLRVPVPPRQEQSEIVEALARSAEQRAIDRAQREIDLLREYRTRLVGDVVTGKLDVRDAAANLLEAEEPELLEEESLPVDDETGEFVDEVAVRGEVEA